MDLKNVQISGTGSCLPGKPIPFNQINEYLGNLTSAPEKLQKWIKKTSKTMEKILGVDFCHYAIDPETREMKEDNVSLSVKASKAALISAPFTGNSLPGRDESS